MAQRVGEILNEKVIPPILKFVNTRPITALKNGMLVVMPLTIVGAIFLLIGNFPIEAFVNWLDAVGIRDSILSVYVATFNMLGMVACFAITYNYVKHAGYEPIPAAVWGMCTMVLLMPHDVTDPDSGVTIGNIISLDWTGSKGMIGGILIAFYTGAVYCYFLKKDITIKMPAGVPPNVATAFTSLIPGIVVLGGAAVIFGVFDRFGTTMMEGSYTALQTPLHGMTDSIGGVILMGFLAPFLWLFGVHGSSIIGGILQPMFQANMADNQKIVDSGLELTVANGGHIVTVQFWDNFMVMTGTGVTVGLVLYMMVWARSSQMKALGRLGGAPAIFNINEPVIFGTPIVMNPVLAVPFVVVPVITGLFQYFCMSAGLAPLYTGVVAPWTTPPIISGFIIGGWRTALMQLVAIVMSIVIYYPFVRKFDSMQYRDELAQAAAEAGAEAESDSEKEISA